MRQPISDTLVLILTAGCTGKTAPTPPSSNLPPAKPVNDPALAAGYVILDRQVGNITSDGKPRDILLIGRKPNVNSNFTDSVWIPKQIEASSVLLDFAMSK